MLTVAEDMVKRTEAALATIDSPFVVAEGNRPFAVEDSPFTVAEGS
jgi:hypothetical protein